MYSPLRVLLSRLNSKGSGESLQDPEQGSGEGVYLLFSLLEPCAS
jgi:hypothetical protein